MIEFLYWGCGPLACREKIFQHKHDYCQLEVILHGQRQCHLQSGKIIELQQGDSVFIPTGAIHGFAPSKDDSLRYLSFKFRVNTQLEHLPEKPFRIKRDFLTEYLINSLRELALEKNDLADSPIYFELIGSLLNIIIKHILQEQKDSEPELLKKLREYVYRFGATATVSDAADKMDMTLPQLRNHFRKAIAALPDKAVHYERPANFIAAELTAIAERHLQIGELTISQIADLLKFNNIYTFSRFFKHNTGLPPQVYRKKNRL